jgi:hypothetical protein
MASGRAEKRAEGGVKIALYIEDGLEQIVLTPESDTERAICGKLHDGSRELSILRGSFYECRGGWVRHRGHVSDIYGVSNSTEEHESTMIVLRPKQKLDEKEPPK